MAGVFRDAHGVIFIEYLEKGRTITGAYYVLLSDRYTLAHQKARGKGTHYNLVPRLMTDKGTHYNLAPRIATGKGTHYNPATRIVRNPRILKKFRESAYFCCFIYIGYNGEAPGGNYSTTNTKSHGWREQSLREPVQLSKWQVRSGRQPGSGEDRH